MSRKPSNSRTTATVSGRCCRLAEKPIIIIQNIQRCEDHRYLGNREDNRQDFMLLNM